MFPTATRGIGPGLAYHAGAAVASILPVLMGVMQDHGTPLTEVMTIAIAATLILSAGLMWLGPETRGRNFSEITDPSQGSALIAPTDEEASVREELLTSN
jgi:hypothetical protein